MNYEEKYNEALKDMRVIYPNLKGDAKLAVEHAFPELTESEDERMLRTIIRGFENWKSNGNVTFNNTDVDDILAYLEKQKLGKIPPYVTGIKGDPDPAGVWKPSEEQMKALLNAEGFLRAGLQHDSAKTIAELYEQLKKL